MNVDFACSWASNTPPFLNWPGVAIVLPFASALRFVVAEWTTIATRRWLHGTVTANGDPSR
ncbi:protein of unknown function [Ralstonia solanacearum CFBP2957]|nr:protein of unknown function [Ralstonia solanacearum CFBP2957]